MYKECNVVMLQSKEKAHFGDIILTPDTNKLLVFEHSNSTEFVQYLYILSNDEFIYPSKGIHYYDGLSSIRTAGTGAMYSTISKNIIASNDATLGFSLIPIDWITLFIDQHNLGNNITKVMVDYNNYLVLTPVNGPSEKVIYNSDAENSEYQPNPKLELNINPNNTINIASIKTNWNKQEHINDIKRIILLEREYKDRTHHFIDKDDLKEFIKQNINPNNTINIKTTKNSWNREELVNNIYKSMDVLIQSHHLDYDIYRKELCEWIKQNI